MAAGSLVTSPVASVVRNSASQRHKHISASQSRSAHLLANRPLAGQRLDSSPFFTGSAVVRFPPQVRTQSVTRGLVIEANLFNRFARVVRSYVFFYGDAAVGSREEPQKMLDQVVNEMQGDLIKMRQTSAQVFAAQKVMEAKYRQAQSGADDWQRRAELALRAGQEDLAREALKRKKAFQDAANTQKMQLEQHTKAVEQLRANIRLLENKTSEAKSKKETLKARAASAQATKMMNEQLQDMVSGLRSSSNSGLAAFAAMEEKVMALEAEAESTMLLAPAGHALESQFLMLEGGTDSIEDELLKLKTEVLADSRPRIVERVAQTAQPGYIQIQVS